MSNIQKNDCLRFAVCTILCTKEKLAERKKDDLAVLLKMLPDRPKTNYDPNCIATIYRLLRRTLVRLVILITIFNAPIVIQSFLAFELYWVTEKTEKAQRAAENFSVFLRVFSAALCGQTNIELKNCSNAKEHFHNAE